MAGFRGVVVQSRGRRVECERWAIEKLVIDKLQMRKCKLYMRYEGGPMNGVECSRW